MDALERSKKGNRVPILDGNGCPKYVIHRSIIDRYLTWKARSGAVDLNTLTLQNFLDDNPDHLKEIIEAFAVIKEDATLTDAKAALAQVAKSQDVFVSPRGTRDETAIGWVTNVMIEENSKL